MKAWKKIVRILLLAVVAIPTAAIVAVQIPAVQTALVGRVAERISRRIDGEIRIGKVYLSFPNNIILKDVDLIHAETDTVAHLGKVLASLKTGSLLFSDNARIRRISIEDGCVGIRRLPDGTTNLAALLAPLKKKEPEADGAFALPWQTVRLDRLTLKRIDLATDSLDVRDIQFSARSLHYGQTASARIENLSLEERRRGFRLKRFSGDAALDSLGLSVRDLRFDDGHTDLRADAALAFTGFSDFSDFTRKVRIDARLRDSRLDLGTIRTLTRADLPELALWLDGRVQGTVSDLASHPLRIRSDSGGTSAELSFRIRGLPDVQHAHIEAEILDSQTTTDDLAEILAAASPDFRKASLQRYAPGEPISLTATAAGPLSELQFTGRLATASMGQAALEGTLRSESGNLAIDGIAKAESLQLGRLLGQKALGSLSCQTDVAFSTAGKDLSLGVESLQIDRFTFRGYGYHDLRATASLEHGVLVADLASGDPNLQLTAHAQAELGGKGKESRYRIDLDLDHADLDALHFDTRDSTALRMALGADIVQTPEGAFLGNADLRGVVATLGEQEFDIGDLALLSFREGDQYLCTLEGDIVRAEYEGNLFITDFAEHAVHRIMKDNVARLLQMDEKHVHQPLPEAYGSFRLTTLDLQDLLDFIAPDVYVSDRSSASIDLIDDDVQGGLSAELVAFGDSFLRNLQARFHTEPDGMRLDIDADSFQRGAIRAGNIAIDARSDSTFVDLQAGFRNEDGSGNRALLHTRFSFPDPTEEGYRVKANILPSDLTVAGHTWELAPSAIFYRKGRIRIDDFLLHSNAQRLRADGVAGTAPTDTLRLDLNDFDISLANSFLKKDLAIQGHLTGRGEAFALLGAGKGILLDLQGNELAMAGVRLGGFQAQSLWNEPAKRMDFRFDNTLDGRHPLLAKGWLRPADKQLSADLLLDSLALGMLEPLLAGLASDMAGSVSGRVKASGPLDKLTLNSEETRLNDLCFKLTYTQVDYVADGPFSISDKGVVFNDILLRDKHGNTGRLNGGIPYEHFRNIRLDTRINLRNMMALNTTARDNGTFYGQAYADGSVRLSGPFNRIRLNLNLTTRENTTVHVPLGNSAKQSQSLLTFINNREKAVDPYDSLILAKQAGHRKQGGGGNELSVNLRLNANPDAEIQIEVDKRSGDVLKARGSGQIGITVDNGNFGIKGDYRVDSGSYHFGMLGFTSRDFSINPGGSIGFTGDIMQSDLNLTATYRTKASISPLIADSTAVSTRRNVDCGIGISGKLANPQIHFSIDIPDLDPTVQNRVESALNTEDKRMKQALALLVSGGFVPDEQSGIVNSTTLLYSNASEMMASQLNNIFRQLDIPLDLGFNYQPSESGRDIFDVAVSTQLFNNRVSINGNIGNRQYISSSTSDIVGDLDIEIKLNRQGQVRMTLFSHSADQYSNYLDQSQRNGAGIVYQEDFNTLGELWRKLFHLKNPDERSTPPDPNAPRRSRPE